VDALIQINPLVAGGMAARQYRAGSCPRWLVGFPPPLNLDVPVAGWVEAAYGAFPKCDRWKNIRSPRVIWETWPRPGSPPLFAFL